MTSPRLQPFSLRKGRLHLEDTDLADVAQGLEGRAAWLVSHAAVEAALDGVRLATKAGRRVRTVAVADVGPRAVLAQCVAAGCWARVASSHELDLAREAGFDAARIVAGGAVIEDGFLRDALTAGVAVIEARGREADNLARIAAALDLPLPVERGAPPALPASAFADCGGLLAPLLAGPPALAIDAVWHGAGAGSKLPQVLPLHMPGASRAARAASLLDLSARRPRRVRLCGPAARGQWVVLRVPGATGVHVPDPSHPLPAVVMVRGAAWRPLEARRLPP